MKSKWMRWAGWLGFAGLWTEVIGFAWAIHLWNKSHPEAYTFLRNFVSELGAPKDSTMGMVMHTTVIAASLLMAPAIYALAVHLNSRLGYAALVFGFLATIGAVGVAFFPMDMAFIMPHLIFALIFFWSWLLTVFFFSLALWRQNSFSGSPALILAGVATWLVTVFFLWVLIRSMGGYLMSGIHGDMNGVLGAPVQNPKAFERPLIWDIAVLEWCVVMASFLWNFAAAHFLLTSKKFLPST